MKADFKLNKSICDTKFIVYFRGHNGHQGHKGHLFSPVFFPWARVEISRGEVVRGNALAPSVRELQETRFFIKCFIYESHTLQFLKHNFIYLEAQW